MRVTKKPSGRVIFFFCCKSCKPAYTTYSGKKNYTTIRFFCYAHLQRKKKITRITTYTFTCTAHRMHTAINTPFVDFTLHFSKNSDPHGSSAANKPQGTKERETHPATIIDHHQGGDLQIKKSQSAISHCKNLQNSARKRYPADTKSSTTGRQQKYVENAATQSSVHTNTCLLPNYSFSPLKLKGSEHESKNVHALPYTKHFWHNKIIENNNPSA